MNQFEYDESNTYVLERFNTTAGNPVKKILLKLNLSDHRILKDGGEVKEVQRSFRHSDTDRLSRSDEVLKLKNFKKDATLKLSKSTNQERMDDPYITIEEYIRHKEEKARKHRKMYNWETAMYGKIWYDEDINDLRSIETEFPAIAFNDGVSSEKTLFCEPTVSSLNDEIDFRISFNDSDDEDYTVIIDKN
ncbi:hypothetical protein Tco_0003999 [Tanacetum coccineum]